MKTINAGAILLYKNVRVTDFSNEVEYYAKPYLVDPCHLNVDQMYEDVKPLYAQLHAHVRKILRDKYGTAAVSSDGPIPVHLLGEYYSFFFFPKPSTR